MTDDDLRQELLAAFEAEYREHLQAMRAALDAGPVSGGVLRDVFRRAHSLKGAARAVDLPAIEAIAHELESRLLAAVEQNQALAPPDADAVRRGLDAIEARMAAPAAAPQPVPDSAPVPPSEPVPSSGPAPAPPVGAEPVSGTVRVATTELDRLAASVQSLSDAVRQQERGRADLADAAAEARRLVSLLDQSATSQGAGRNALQAGGELERGLRRLSRRLGATLRDRAALDWTLDSATQSLRDHAEQLVLVEAGSVFASLAGMARDLAREAGTEIAITLDGMQTRAERRMLQALRDPTIQLLRNAIGHGLRRDGAMPSIGLRIGLSGGRLDLVVRDDGPGPDLGRIERTAIARGLLPARGADRPAPPASGLLALVFEPGFSTADTTDRLSGRGMGLSIVAEAARRLHGTATMRPGRNPAGAPCGTEIVLSLPLAARRQSLLLTEAAGHLIGLPGQAVRHLLRIPSDAVEWPERRPVTRLAGAGGATELLALSALAPLLGGDDPLSPDPLAPGSADMLPIALLEAGGRRCGMVVDRLHDVRTLLVQAPDLVGIDRRLVAGVAVAARDRPVLVLDPEALVDTLLAADPAPNMAPAVTPATHRRPPVRSQATILVVDDSLTTRTLERTILQAQGYRVLIAVDGLEALDVLRTAQWEVDVVVADVEMPRLDGFGLLAAMQADPRLASIPTVLMTSRNAEADVTRGLSLGARAYIAKQSFDQGLLLSTIGRLLP